MDFARPVEAIVPGARGRVLEALTRTNAELTIRTIAELSGVSVNRAAAVVGDLVDLGLVTRRDIGRAALIRLDAENEASRLLMSLAGIRNRVVDRLREAAKLIQPPPESLILFGSLARGDARIDSDVDVLAVRSLHVSPDDDAWTDSLGDWTSRARSISGNPVNLIEVGVEEVPRLLRRRGDTVWKAILAEGVLLRGSRLADLGSVA